MQADDELPDAVLARAIEGLEDRPPDGDLWANISPRLARRRPGMLELRWPVAVAAGLVLVAASVGGTAAWLDGRAAQPVAALVTTPGSVMVTAASESDLEVSRAIAELETLLQDNVTNIGTDTYRALATSLAILDQAIAGAAERQRAMPDDTSAQRHFSASLRKKLDVLEKVTLKTSIRS
jgi:hypothetical protein